MSTFASRTTLSFSVRLGDSATAASVAQQVDGGSISVAYRGGTVGSEVMVAVGESSVILLTSPLHRYRHACQRESGAQQNDSLADG